MEFELPKFRFVALLTTCFIAGYLMEYYELSLRSVWPIQKTPLYEAGSKR